MSIYTLHNTILMNTHCTSLSTTYFFLFYYIMIYVFTLKHLNIPVNSSNILHPLILMSLIIPFLPIIIINFTIIFYPLSVWRCRFPFTLFVNQYSYWRSLKRRVGTCSIIEWKPNIRDLYSYVVQEVNVNACLIKHIRTKSSKIVYFQLPWNMESILNKWATLLLQKGPDPW